MHYIIWGAVITAGYEILSWLVSNVPRFAGAQDIPIRAKHLDVLEWIDVSCECINIWLVQVNIQWHCHVSYPTSVSVKFFDYSLTCCKLCRHEMVLKALSCNRNTPSILNFSLQRDAVLFDDVLFESS